MRTSALVFLLAGMAALSACEKEPVTADDALTQPIAANAPTEPLPAPAVAPTPTVADPASLAVASPTTAPTPTIADPASLAVIAPATYQPATAADAALAPALFAQIQSACATQDAPLFFSLYTERVRYGFSRQTSDELTKYFANMCGSLPAIAEKLAAGVSISPHPRSKEGGLPISLMCPKTPDGICESGIDVGMEGGQLKLSDW